MQIHRAYYILNGDGFWEREGLWRQKCLGGSRVGETDGLGRDIGLG